MIDNAPESINEAIKILSYNDFLWDNVKPHPKDRKTVESLAGSQYTWTEKQGKLAVIIIKRYITKFEQHGIKVRRLCDSPVFAEPFRVINSQKAIEIIPEDVGADTIELRFPYSQKIVNLIRTLKDKKGIPTHRILFDGETKIWNIKKSDVTTYFCTLIAVRYNFEIVTPSILDEYEEIKKEKLMYKKILAEVVNEKIKLYNAPETLNTYWKENLLDKKLLQQIDALKNLGVSHKSLRAPAYSSLGKKIAHSDRTNIWINKNIFTKDAVMLALKELDCFPILMPISGEVTDTPEDITDLWNWIECFERHGIDTLKEVSWGANLREPVQNSKDSQKYHEELFHFSKDIKLSKEVYDNAFELSQMSKQFKNIIPTTKIYFMRNSISRTFTKSNFKAKASLITLGGGYYAPGSENFKRLLDSLPKKLYYSNYEPSTWNEQITVIKK